jgi:parallel beta-helix repeat protein
MGNVTVRNMMITNFSDGIQLASSSNNTLSGNNVANNEFGIYLDSSSDNNTISNNNITANSQSGIVLDTSSNYNTLSGNNITANIGAGIWLYSSSKNTIYHNNFNNNTNQVYSYDSTNVWDNGSVGNYWSDYLTRYPNAAQVDSSGVWNAPYVIDANNTDYYPLVGPIGVIPEFQSFLILPLMMMATLLAVIIYKKKGVKTSQS